MQLYLIGIYNLVVEVNASYIRGMLSNLDVQPNAAINQWIATILLFNFKLMHILADKHKGPDSLSRHKPTLDKEEDKDPEDWVDSALTLGIWVTSWLDTSPANMHCTDVLALSINDANTDDDNDFPQHTCPQHNHNLPARYHNGNFVPSNMTCAQPPASDSKHSSSTDSDDEALAPHTQDNDNSNSNIKRDLDPTNPCTHNDSSNHPDFSNGADINDTINNNTNNNNNTNTINPNENAHTINTPQILNNIINTTDCTHPAPAQFATCDKAKKADNDIKHICRYLLSQHAPPNLHGNALTRFLSRTCHFLISNG
jgi:hypothetical protein